MIGKVTSGLARQASSVPHAETRHGCVHVIEVPLQRAALAALQRLLLHSRSKTLCKLCIRCILCCPPLRQHSSAQDEHSSLHCYKQPSPNMPERDHGQTKV